MDNFVIVPCVLEYIFLVNVYAHTHISKPGEPGDFTVQSSTCLQFLKKKFELLVSDWPVLNPPPKT